MQRLQPPLPANAERSGERRLVGGALKGDKVFADFIVHHLPIGVVGIVLGSVFSAAMSTLSSSLSASASALVNDFILPMTGRAAEVTETLNLPKLCLPSWKL